MKFWIFMFIMSLLIPAVMIVFGVVFLKKPPKHVNMIYGYRTKRSMMNAETWKFAHGYFGKRWLIWGLAMLPVSALIMICAIGKSDDTVGLIGCVLEVLQLILMMGPILPTEKALKNRFDEKWYKKSVIS